MALLKICVYPNPVLRIKAEPLLQFGAAEQKFFDDMIETMYTEDGVGLAAPQVGVSKRVLIACPTMKAGEEIVLVNPEIYELKGQELGIEGCLSFPGISAEITRAKTIKVRYLDRFGKKQNTTANDFYARIIQHELDHLEGKLLIDRVGFDQRQELLSQYKKTE